MKGYNHGVASLPLAGNLRSSYKFWDRMVQLHTSALLSQYSLEYDSGGYDRWPVASRSKEDKTNGSAPRLRKEAHCGSYMHYLVRIQNPPPRALT